MLEIVAEGFTKRVTVLPARLPFCPVLRTAVMMAASGRRVVRVFVNSLEVVRSWVAALAISCYTLTDSSAHRPSTGVLRFAEVGLGGARLRPMATGV